MPISLATPNPFIHESDSSQLGGVYETSSDEELEASATDNGQSILSTDSSVSSMSLSDEEEEENRSSPYSSEGTVRGRVPPNTPKKAECNTSNHTCNLEGKMPEDTAMSVLHSSAIRERRISRLSDELHTILAPHTLGHPAHRRSMPDGNSYHYVYNEPDYHMHYHQQQDTNHTTQRQPIPISQHHTSTPNPQHNLCPAEYDRVDRWRILANTFTPSPIRSPDCGSVICTPLRDYDKDGGECYGGGAEGSKLMSPTLLAQKLRVLSNDLNRVPLATTAPVDALGGRMSFEMGGGRNARGSGSGSGGAKSTGAGGANRAFERRRKELLQELADLAERASQEISSPFPSRTASHSSPRKPSRHGSKGIGATRRPYDGSNWVVVGGGMEMKSGAGFHESSMSEVDCQWDAPKPKFLQKLFH